MENAIAKLNETLEKKEYVDIATTDTQLVASRLKALDAMGEAIKSALICGVDNDYAIIPGTNKPSLLQPGARKICLMFGLTARFPQEEFVINQEKGIVNVKCELWRGDQFISESRAASAIKKTNRDQGWETNSAIKIAQKRAMIGATLQVANLSKIFTQDMEDAKPEIKESQFKEEIYKLYRMFFAIKSDKNWVREQVLECAKEIGIETTNIFQEQLTEEQIHKLRSQVEVKVATYGK